MEDKELVKITDLPKATSIDGLVTIGVDNENSSVQVGIQQLGDAIYTDVEESLLDKFLTVGDIVDPNTVPVLAENMYGKDAITSGGIIYINDMSKAPFDGSITEVYTNCGGSLVCLKLHIIELKDNKCNIIKTYELPKTAGLKKYSVDKIRIAQGQYVGIEKDDTNTVLYSGYTENEGHYTYNIETDTLFFVYNNTVNYGYTLSALGNHKAEVADLKKDIEANVVKELSGNDTFLKTVNLLPNTTGTNILKTYNTTSEVNIGMVTSKRLVVNRDAKANVTGVITKVFLIGGSEMEHIDICVLDKKGHIFDVVSATEIELIPNETKEYQVNIPINSPDYYIGIRKLKSNSSHSDLFRLKYKDNSDIGHYYTLEASPIILINENEYIGYGFEITNDMRIRPSEVEDFKQEILDEAIHSVESNIPEGGYAPKVGEKGNLVVYAPDGKIPVYEIGDNDNWWLDGVDTGKRAVGDDGSFERRIALEMNTSEQIIPIGEDMTIYMAKASNVSKLELRGQNDTDWTEILLNEDTNIPLLASVFNYILRITPIDNLVSASIYIKAKIERS